MYKFLIIASILVASSLAEVRLMRSRPLPDGRIVGGEDANIEDHPYQVSFEYYGGHRCGASIISLDWVVTAAHCVDGVPAFLVDFRAGSSIRGSGGTLHRASEIIVHENYDYWTLDYDIAVMKVSIPFIYGDAVKPIPLAKDEPTTGQIATVSGWGALSDQGYPPLILQVVRVPIVDREICNLSYAIYGGITKSMICAAVERGGRDACQGDSGGPLVVNEELAGVVSSGIGCAQARYPGVYANIAHLREFVVRNTGVE